MSDKRTFLEVVNEGMNKQFTPMGRLRPLTEDIAGNPIPKAPSDDKEKRMAEIEKLARDTFGPAGSIGLGLFADGHGVEFGISEGGEPMATALGEKDKRLVIGGQEVPDAEVLREYLRKRAALKK